MPQSIGKKLFRMANITINKTGERIKVDFGDYYGVAPQVDYKVNNYQRANIEAIADADTYIHIKMRNLMEWRVGISGIDVFIVDSVNGVTPTDLTHLLDLLSQLME